MRDSATGSGGQSLTVHQWLGRLAPDYLRRFGPAMPARQRQVLSTILSCRTPARGGELFACPDGHGFDYRYHSCNDRHCPLCGQTDADDWLRRQRARLLLPAPYFLLTFTVPEQLRGFIRSHLRIGLELLFAASAQALQDLAANPRRLGAQLGMLGVLHTWSRTLIFHPHNRLVSQLPDARLLWTYRHSRTHKHTSIALEPANPRLRTMPRAVPAPIAQPKSSLPADPPAAKLSAEPWAQHAPKNFPQGQTLLENAAPNLRRDFVQPGNAINLK